MKEEILKIFTNKMYHVYCPDQKIEDYQVRNLARQVHRMATVFIKELETLDRIGE